MLKTTSTIPVTIRAVKNAGVIQSACSPSSLTRSNTPLHNASIQAHADVCEYLVASKADTAARDRCVRGRTLHILSTHLLPSSSGDTPLKVAVREQNSGVEAYLRSIGAPE